MEGLLGEAISKVSEIYGDYSRGRQMRLGNANPILKSLGKTNRPIRKLGNY